MTRVCFLSSMHPAMDKRVFEKEAITLASAGFSVSHVCPGAVDEAGIHRGIEIITYPRPAGLWDRVRRLGLLYKLGRRQRADIYHCNEVDSWLVGVALKVVGKARCVFDVHEHYPSKFAESRFPSWARSGVAAMVRLAFRTLAPVTDRIVLAKRTVAAEFSSCSEKCVLVQNFTPLEGVSLAEGRLPRATGAPMTIVHLGYLNRIRGWPQILDAMAKLDSNIRLKVIGAFDDGSLTDFERRVRELALCDRVFVHDWMSFEDAFRCLVDAEVGIVAFQPNILNHVYALPHKVFDYMAAGMAVVMPKLATEVAVIIESERCGLLIDSSSPSDIAEKIAWLYANPEEAHEMGKRGQVAIQERFNWEIEAKKLVDMYRNL